MNKILVLDLSWEFAIGTLNFICLFPDSKLHCQNGQRSSRKRARPHNVCPLCLVSFGKSSYSEHIRNCASFCSDESDSEDSVPFNIQSADCSGNYTS